MPGRPLIRHNDRHPNRHLHLQRHGRPGLGDRGPSSYPLPGTTQTLTYTPQGQTAAITSPAGTSTQTSRYIYDETITADVVGLWRARQNGTLLGPRCTPGNQLACMLNPLFGTLIAGDDGGQDPMLPDGVNTSMDLGIDPATGSFRQSEYETALRIQQERGVVLQRSANPAVDWVDANGNTYDAVGNVNIQVPGLSSCQRDRVIA